MVRRDLSKKDAAHLFGVTPASVSHWVKLGYLEASRMVQGHVDKASVERLKGQLAVGSVSKLRARANKTHAKGFFIPFALGIEAAERKKFDELICFIRNYRLPAAVVLFCLALNLAADTVAEEAADMEAGEVCASLREILCGQGDDVRCAKTGGSFYDSLSAEFFAFRGWLEDSGVWPKEWGSRRENKRARFFSDGSFSEAKEGRENVWQTLLFWDLPLVPDILGVVYQVCTQENVKVRQGAYFTPQHVVDAIAEDNWAPGREIFDPCCGVGKFLLSFAAKGAEPEELWGMDVDPLAVHLARLNLLLFYRRPIVPRIFHGNSLRRKEWNGALREMIGRFDVVATNPPWGARVEEEDRGILREGGVGRDLKRLGRDSFSLFVVLGVACLARGGHLSFVLPEAFLMVKGHEDLRRFILDHGLIDRIEELGAVFHRVLSAAVRIDFSKADMAGDTLRREMTEKGTAKKETDEHKSETEVGEVGTSQCFSGDGGAQGHKIEVVVRSQPQSRAGSPVAWLVDQRRFAGNRDTIFDIWVSDEDKAILDKIESVPHQTLAGQAQWVLGIVTGDNARLLFETVPDEILSGGRRETREKRDAYGVWDAGRNDAERTGTERRGLEGIVRGGDVSAFRLKEPSCFLRFEPDRLQQAAREALYRMPKLVYRFIANRPVMAYDAAGCLTLNSANSVIVNIEGYPVQAVEALFNSRVYAYFFYHKFHALKVLRAYLERMPLPLWPTAGLERLAEAAKKLSSPSLSVEKRGELLTGLETEIMQGFALNEGEKARINAWFTCITKGKL